MNYNKKLTAGIYIPDENGMLHTLEAWSQREDRTAADGVVLVMDFYVHMSAIKVAKYDIEGLRDFDNAQAAATALGADWRPSSVHEGVELYRAKHLYGLNEALRAIGGDAMSADYYWTCASAFDSDYQCSAFVVDMDGGNVRSGSKLINSCVRAVSALKD